MTRHLTTVALAGILGSVLLAGNAEACHKNKCNRCARPVVCAPRRSFAISPPLAPGP